MLSSVNDSYVALSNSNRVARTLFYFYQFSICTHGQQLAYLLHSPCIHFQVSVRFCEVGMGIVLATWYKLLTFITTCLNLGIFKIQVL